MPRFGLLLPIILLATSTTSDLLGENRQAIFDAIAARHETLQNVQVDYKQEETHTPPIELVRQFHDSSDALENILLLQGTYLWNCRFRYVGRRSFYEQWPPEGKSGPLNKYQSSAFSKTRVETRSGNSGTIRASDSLPLDAVIDCALGLRLKGENAWLKTNEWSSCTLQEHENGTITLSLRPLNASYEGRREDRWTFDPKLGYALIHYVVNWVQKDSQDTFTDIEIDNSDFRPDPKLGLMLPHTIQFKKYYTQTGAKPIVTVTNQLTVSSYKIGELEDTDEAFLTAWPEGTIVLDDRNNRTVVVSAGTQKLTDDILQKYYSEGPEWLEQKTSKSSLRSWLVIGNLIAVFALGLYWNYRRRKKRVDGIAGRS